MRPPTPVTESRIAELEEFRKSKWSGEEFQRFLCVWLRVKQGMTTKEIAITVGWHVNSVRRVQKDFVDNGTSALVSKKTGGRIRQNMTLEEEKLFLKAFDKVASNASMVVVNEVKDALEKYLGHTIHLSSVYRLMHRHGWRKLVPRPRHPKQNKELAEAFKKRASLKG